MQFIFTWWQTHNEWQYMELTNENERRYNLKRSCYFPSEQPLPIFNLYNTVQTNSFFASSEYGHG